MSAQPTQAVLLDALGTLVRLEPPGPLLRDELRARLGVELTEAEAAVAVRAEIAYYRAHLHEAVDAASLAGLRERCARVVRDELPEQLRSAPLAVVHDALLAALRFSPFPEVIATLAELRERGLRLVVVSNWDVSLHEVLAATGLDVLVDGAIASSECGSAKPDPVIVRRGLEIAGVGARDAWLVGDTPEADVAGARAAGVRPVLIDRDGEGLDADGAPVIGTLDRLASLID